MDKDKIKEKLKKVKALAEQGVGGEKDDALVLYYKLLAKYEMTEEDVEEVELERMWFRYSNDLDKLLLTQIFCKVTGNPTFYIKVDKRRRLVGLDCTEFERDMIVFYYQFYDKLLKKELDKFIVAFFNANNIFPDETTRCYNQYKDMEGKERSKKDWMQIDLMAAGMDRETPNLQIEQKKGE